MGSVCENEATCRRCGGQNIEWSAPSPLWNAVMRGGSINGPWQFNEIICPTCFALLAEGSGIASGWRLYATDVHVELETVTPSGRVWNPATWLWEDAPAAGEQSTSLVIQLVGTRGERHKTIEFPLPDGFEWPAETDHVVDFLDKGEVFLVRGLQVSARNRSATTAGGGA